MRDWNKPENLAAISNHIASHAKPSVEDELKKQKAISSSLAKQRDEILLAIQKTNDALRRAGASLPAPEVKGSIESSILTGLSIALAVLEANTQSFIDKQK